MLVILFIFFFQLDLIKFIKISVHSMKQHYTWFYTSSAVLYNLWCINHNQITDNMKKKELQVPIYA